MIFRVLHTTTYSYSDPVSISFHEAVLAPRATARQTVLKSGLAVEPKVQNLTARQDYFGNVVTRFTVAGDHRKLEVESESLLGISDAGVKTAKILIPIDTNNKCSFTQRFFPQSSFGQSRLRHLARST